MIKQTANKVMSVALTLTMSLSGILSCVPVYASEDTAYSVSIADTENGTLHADADSAKAGETVTVTAEPSEGYQTETVETSPEVEISETEDNVFRFEMPESDVTISGSFAKADVSAEEEDSADEEDPADDSTKEQSEAATDEDGYPTEPEDDFRDNESSGNNIQTMTNASSNTKGKYTVDQWITYMALIYAGKLDKLPSDDDLAAVGSTIDIVASLTKHASRYLGTPYLGYPSSTWNNIIYDDSGYKKAWNCTGFWQRAYYDAIVDYLQAEPYNKSESAAKSAATKVFKKLFVESGYYGGEGNFTSRATSLSAYDRVLFCITGTDDILKSGGFDFKFKRYSTTADAIESGTLTKGSTLILEPKVWKKGYSDCHIGFFWGDKPTQNRFWNSTGSSHTTKYYRLDNKSAGGGNGSLGYKKGGNRISQIVPKKNEANYVYAFSYNPPYLVKSFFLENQGFFQYIINKYLRRRSHRNGHFSVSGTKIVGLGYTK